MRALHRLDELPKIYLGLLAAVWTSLAGCHNTNSDSDEASQPPESDSSDSQGQQPVPVTGTNLADYNNTRVRCDYTTQSPGQYQAQCVAVAHQADGSEYFAVGLSPGVSLNWQTPQTLNGNATYSNCAPSSNTLTYVCNVSVPDTTTPAQVQFGASIADGASNRLETSVLLLPYSVGITLGFVPGMPVTYQQQNQTLAAQSLSLTTSGASSTVLTPTGFQQYNFGTSAGDFFHSLAVCVRGSKVYFSDGIFVYQQTGSQISLYGGSGNPIDVNNTTSRLQVYLKPWALACTTDAVYVLSRDLYRIHKLTDDGNVQLLVGSSTWGLSPDGTVAAGAPMESLNGLAVAPSGQVYFGEGSLLRTILNDGTLSTVGGNGTGTTAATAGDGGPASKASFGWISAIVIGPDNSIYVADNNFSNVRKITPDGLIHTFAGTGVARFDDPTNNPRDLAEPLGMTMDTQGNLYIGEFYRGIKKIDTNGVMTQVVSAGPDIPYSFSNATIAEWQYVPIAAADLAIFNSRPAFQGIAAGSDGTLYMNGTHGLWAQPPGSSQISVLSGPSPTDAQTNCGPVQPGNAARLVEASALTYAANNHLRVIDWLALDSNQLVIRDAYDSGTTVLTQNIAGCAQESWLSGTNVLNYRGPTMVLDNIGAITTGPDGNTYVANRSQGKIYRYTQNGTATLIAGTGAGVSSGDNGPALQASLLNPSSLAFGPDGSLYFTEYNGDLIVNQTAGSRLRRIDTTGTITTVAGNGVAGDFGEGGPAVSASFSISSVAVGTDGRIYLADLGNNKIKMIDTSGNIHTIAGNGSILAQANITGTVDALQAALWGPLGIAVSNDGMVYFTDFGSSQVKQLKPRPTGGYDLVNLFGKASSGSCGTSTQQGKAAASSINTAIEASMAILCEGQPRAITIKDTCPQAGGSTRIAFSQMFSTYVNVVEIVRPCTGT